jgi:hypothetical protein
MEKFRSGISAPCNFTNRLVRPYGYAISRGVSPPDPTEGTTGFRIANGRQGNSMQSFLVADRIRPSDRDGASCLASRMFIGIERAI